MVKKKGHGFTLIELIAVLVIMAIIALIATPLVMNIIRKARISADKRSIDAYGRSIELAIAGYLLDTGSFPTSVGELTIEYSGNEVVCTTTQLNSDSSVYLDGCTVAGRSVEGYTYGKEETIIYEAYQVGDHVSYNGVTYYVIEDSDTTNNTVKLLKENPLTETEMDNLNPAGAGNTVGGPNGDGNGQYGSSADYSKSTVKQVVDAWKNSAVASGDTATARLITFEEVHSLGYSDTVDSCCGGLTYYAKTDYVPSWVYNVSKGYWTMSRYGNGGILWYVSDSGELHNIDGLSYLLVRPVLELNKSADITKID